MSWLQDKRPVEAERVAEELTALMESDEFSDLFKEDPNYELDMSWLPDWDLGADFVGYFFWGLLILLAALLLVTLLRQLGMLGGKKRTEDQDEPGEHRRRRVAEALEAAVAAREAGDLRLALRHYWSALVTGLGRGKAVAWRPAWTCREMLARSRPGSSAVRLLGELLPEVERLEFGRDPVTAGDVRRLAALCDEHLPAVLRREELDT